jgi:hypothetical protein
MQLVKNKAATILVDGLKSIEVAQAFLLLALWPTPYRRWEENRSWLYIRLAISYARSYQLLPLTHPFQDRD